MGDLLRELKRDEREIDQCPVTPKHLAEMLSMIKEGTISGKIAKDVFEEIGRGFRAAHPGARVVFNFAGSGDLARQIEAGAPVDVFASAAQKDMDDLDRKGMIVKETRKDFAGNRIILIIPFGNSILMSISPSRSSKIGRKNFMLWANSKVSSVKTSAIPHILTPRMASKAL
jgi:hypothetical protein